MKRMANLSQNLLLPLLLEMMAPGALNSLFLRQICHSSIRGISRTTKSIRISNINLYSLNTSLPSTLLYFFNSNLMSFFQLSIKKKYFLGFLLIDQLLFRGLNCPVFANQNFPQNPTSSGNILSQHSGTNKNLRFSQSLDTINEMKDSHLKVMLLNDLALSYAKSGNIDKAEKILNQALSIIENFDDITLKITNLTNLANHYHIINRKIKAFKLLENTLDVISRVEDKSLQGQLLLSLSLKYGEMGKEKKAETLFAQSQTLITEAAQPIPEFPFTAIGSNLQLGLTGNVQSFRDTTAAVGINVNFYQQWAEDDFSVDGSLFLNYDSSRAVNNYRPNSFIISVYRHHFDDQWNFFTDFFNSTNQDLFSSKNDDEDLTILSNLLVGAGLNLWRGDSPRQFLDIQFGVGPRYQYEYIDFEERRNRIDPTIGVILLGRGFSIENATVNQNFAIIPSVDDWNDYSITSDTNLSIPISDRWSLSNRLFLRYRNEVIYERNPKLEFLFTTGVNYQF